MPAPQSVARTSRLRQKFTACYTLKEAVYAVFFAGVWRQASANAQPSLASERFDTSRKLLRQTGGHYRFRYFYEIYDANENTIQTV